MRIPMKAAKPAWPNANAPPMAIVGSFGIRFMNALGDTRSSPAWSWKIPQRQTSRSLGQPLRASSNVSSRGSPLQAEASRIRFADGRARRSTATMKAAYINQTGPPEVIKYGDLPDPKPGTSECLVRVVAVDVNPIDVYIRAGMIPARLNFPYIIGRDLAGTVIETGPNVKQYKPGDRVWVTGQGVDGRPGSF